METTGPRVGEAIRTAATERLTANARILGGVLALTQYIVFTEENPPGVSTLGILLAIATLTLGVATHLWLRSQPKFETLRSMVMLTLGLDVVLLVAFNLIMAWEDGATTRGLMLIVILEGAMKYTRSGAWTVFLSLVGMELARGVVRAEVFNAGADHGETVFFIGLAMLVTLFAAEMSALARSSIDQAEAAAADADQTRADLNALHAVLLQGIEAIVTRTPNEMLKDAATAVGFAQVRLYLLDDDGHARLDGELVALPPASTAARALVSETSEPVRHADVDVEIAIPIVAEDGIVGALLFSDPTNERRASDEMLVSLANQTGMVLRGARAFAREAAASRRVAELDQLKTDFITVASHELRTPLTAVLGFAETLNQPDLDLPDTVRQSMYDSIFRQALRLKSLVNDLNTVLELDGGQLDVRRARTDVGKAVRRAVAASNVDDASVDLGVVEVFAAVDNRHLERIVLALVQNAGRHGEPPVTVRVRGRDSAVTIEVSDAGPGVPVHMVDSLFERFSLGTAVESHAQGAGLGLPIARELAQLMGGDVHLHPSQAGATFVITLPSHEGDPLLQMVDLAPDLSNVQLN